MTPPAAQRPFAAQRSPDAPRPLAAERPFAVLAAALSVACLGWLWFVDFGAGAGELVRAAAGLVALWAPLGAVAYRSLRGRVDDRLTRFTLSAAASYALTTPLYAAFGLADFWLPGFLGLFYMAEGLLFAAALLGLRRSSIGKPDIADAADVARTECARGGFFGRVDWILTLLIALSLLVTPRYKEFVRTLPDGSHKLITHGDVTYLAALAYELSRHTPALEQSVRAGVKERAYHNYSHLTTMLVARYAGQHDMLRALMRYEFTVVEVLLCLLFFLIARRLTDSRWAGYLAVASLYVLAIPTPPLVANDLGYFFFTWHPHATSNLEGAVIASPQMYCALPVVFGALLAAMQFSERLGQRAPLGAIAVLLALFCAALLRFRVQTFLLLYPAVMALLAIAFLRTRERSLLLAGALGLLLVAGQAIEMRSSIYFPDTSRMRFQSTHIMHTHAFLNAWPGAGAAREWLQVHCGPTLFLHGWQLLCAAMFALLNMAGIPVAIAALAHFARPATWRSAAWAYSGLTLWLAIGSILGATCVGTTYDMYSVGGQMLLMVGWYLAPLLPIALWQAARRLNEWTANSAPSLAPRLASFGVVAGSLVLAGACLWQRTRPPSPLELKVVSLGTEFSAGEWQALEAMREGLPRDAVLLSKVESHDPFACVFSGIVGRRAYLEYRVNQYFAGGPREDNRARQARIDRVWNAATDAEFAAAASETGATHLVEYDRWPLAAHPPERLELWWSSAAGEMRVWRVRAGAGCELSDHEDQPLDKLIAADRP